MLGDDPAWAERAAAFSARVRDLGEFLADVEPRAPRHPLNLRVAMQDSCHLRHAQRLPLSSAASLRRIPGLTVVEPAEQDICCGSAGIYNVTQADAARQLGDRKAAHVARHGRAGATRAPTPAASSRSRRRCAGPAARCRHSTRSSSSTPRSGTSAGGPAARRRAADRCGARQSSAPSCTTLGRFSAGARRRAAARRAGRRARAPGRSAYQPTAIAIVSTPPITTAGTAPTSAAATPGLERAELVRGADEHHLDGVDAAAQLVRRDERQDRLPQHDADHVDAAADRERERARATSTARARRRRSRRRRAPTTASSVGPACRRTGQRVSTIAEHERADGRRRAQHARGPPARRRARPWRRRAAARRHRRTGRRRGRARSRRAARASAGSSRTPPSTLARSGDEPPAAVAPGAERAASRPSASADSAAADGVDELRSGSRTAGRRSPARRSRTPGTRSSAARAPARGSPRARATASAPARPAHRAPTRRPCRTRARRTATSHAAPARGDDEQPDA